MVLKNKMWFIKGTAAATVWKDLYGLNLVLIPPATKKFFGKVLSFTADHKLKPSQQRHSVV